MLSRPIFSRLTISKTFSLTTINTIWNFLKIINSKSFLCRIEGTMISSYKLQNTKTLLRKNIYFLKTNLFNIKLQKANYL